MELFLFWKESNIGSHIVNLSDLKTMMTEDTICSHDVKHKVGKRIRQNIVSTNHVGSWKVWKSCLSGCRLRKIIFRESREEIYRLLKTIFEICKSLFIIIVFWIFFSRKSRCHTLCIVRNNLYLFRKWEHIRRKVIRKNSCIVCSSFECLWFYFFDE